jgi:hypothetical protein
MLRNRLLSLALMNAALAQGSAFTQDVSRARLEDLELGPDGIQRKDRPPTQREHAKPETVRGAPFKPARPRYRLRDRSDEDIIARIAKQLAKRERRARRAGLVWIPPVSEFSDEVTLTAADLGMSEEEFRAAFEPVEGEVVGVYCCAKGEELGVLVCPECEAASRAYSDAMGPSDDA